MNHSAIASPQVQHSYRPDIDGLRAVSVLVVVFYHAGISWFSGGFVGVDVFFVISGFLITKIIIDDINSDKFSFMNFYERRIRRIIPALVSVYIVCFIFGAIILLPGELKDFGKSLARSAYFVSNIYFYDTSGYFDAPSHTKPLLHTWSLSVEEQFYIVWPIILLIAFKSLQQNWRLGIFSGAIIASIVYAEWEIARQDNAAAFYLLQARAWELLLGAMVAFSPFRFRSTKILSEMLAVAGLSLIILSAILLSQHSSFPGFNALFPCLGAVLIITSGQYHDTFVSRLLRLRPVVAIGLISYSLYLWHWPIFSFAHTILDRPPQLAEALPLILLSFLVAYLSWRFIEQRFRMQSGGLGRSERAARSVVGIGVATICVFIVAGVGTDSADGLPSRFGEDVRRIVKSAEERGKRHTCYELPASYPSGDACDLNVVAGRESYDVVLVGDSHAGHYAAGVASILRQLGASGRLMSRGGCLPLPEVRTWTNGQIRNKCISLRDNVETFLFEQKQGQLVILAARWAVYTEDKRSEIGGGMGLRLIDDKGEIDTTHVTSRRVFKEKLNLLIKKLSDSGRDVLILGQVPPHPTNPVPCVVKAMHRDASMAPCMLPRREAEKRLSFSNSVIREIAESYPNVWAFLPSELICKRKRCGLFLDRVYLYRDDDHINVGGSKVLAKYFKKTPAFDKLNRTI